VLDISPLGLVSITITDSANPANVFTTSFTNPLTYGASVALFRSPDAPGTGDGQYANFSITQAPTVPEPSTFMLVSLAGAGLIFAGRRRRVH
jgi:hypothetical protein